MKNTIKALGFIVLIAIIGFSMLACDASGGEGDTSRGEGTYWYFSAQLPIADYESIFGNFGDYNDNYGFLTGDRNTLRSKVNQALNLQANTFKESLGGVTYSQIKEVYLDTLPAQEATIIENRLRNQGFFVITSESPQYFINYFGAFSE